MRILEVFFIPFFLIFFFFFTSTMVTSNDNCSYSRCSNSEVRVRFPFSLEDYQQESCGYPGFNLTCNRRNKTVIELGSWGEFLVRDIDYATQEVILNDQDNCLPKRLMNINLSGSPLKAAFYENFLFYNCSSNITYSFMEPITCLSTSNYTVYSVPSMGRGRYIFSLCDFITTVMVPTPTPSREFYEFGYQADVLEDLHLVWYAPNCAECVQRGGKCGFKNSKSSDVRCFDLPRRGLPKAVKYVLSIGVGIPILMCVILITCYICGRCKSYNGNNHHFHHRNFESSSVMPQAPIFVVGLDEAVIQSYPKTVLGESRRLAKPDDNICAICLSEYQAKDTLKTIPSCKHCFHAGCIDEWLHRNATCPLCRNAPMPVPLPPPLPAP